MPEKDYERSLVVILPVMNMWRVIVLKLVLMLFVQPPLTQTRLLTVLEVPGTKTQMIRHKYQPEERDLPNLSICMR